MKKYLILFALIFSGLFLFAQPPANNKKIVYDWFNQSLDLNDYYIDIPNSPFSSGYNRTQTGLTIAGQLRPTDLGSPAGDLDVVFTSNFTDGLTYRDLGANRFRFTNNNVWTIGLNTKGLASLLINDDIQIYGLDENKPIIIDGDLTGQSAINWITSTTGPNFTLQNVVSSSSFAGLLASGNTLNYGKFSLSFNRLFGSDLEGEVIYIGNTGGTFAVTDSVIIKHHFGTDKGRDALQIGHTDSLWVTNFTAYDCGKTNTAQQDHAIQLVDTNGIIEFSVFDKVPRLCNIFAHGITIKDTYFRVTDLIENGFIGRTDNLSYYPTARFNGLPITFLRCYIKDDSGIVGGALVAVQERIANVEFRDCVFDTDRTQLYDDQRLAGYTNTLIGDLTTNGNSVQTLPNPSYISLTKSDYNTHGLNNNIWFLLKGLGYRIKRP